MSGKARINSCFLRGINAQKQAELEIHLGNPGLKRLFPPDGRLSSLKQCYVNLEKLKVPSIARSGTIVTVSESGWMMREDSTRTVRYYYTIQPSRRLPGRMAVLVDNIRYQKAPPRRR
jgi:hypothetical protein